MSDISTKGLLGLVNQLLDARATGRIVEIKQKTEWRCPKEPEWEDAVADLKAEAVQVVVIEFRTGEFVRIKASGPEQLKRSLEALNITEKP